MKVGVSEKGRTAGTQVGAHTGGASAADSGCTCYATVPAPIWWSFKCSQASVAKAGKLCGNSLIILRLARKLWPVGQRRVQGYSPAVQRIPFDDALRITSFFFLAVEGEPFPVLCKLQEFFCLCSL